MYRKLNLRKKFILHYHIPIVDQFDIGVRPSVPGIFTAQSDSIRIPLDSVKQWVDNLNLPQNLNNELFLICKV